MGYRLKPVPTSETIYTQKKRDISAFSPGFVGVVNDLLPDVTPGKRRIWRFSRCLDRLLPQMTWASNHSVTQLFLKLPEDVSLPRNAGNPGRIPESWIWGRVLSQAVHCKPWECQIRGGSGSVLLSYNNEKKSEWNTPRRDMVCPVKTATQCSTQGWFKWLNDNMLWLKNSIKYPLKLKNEFVFWI